MKKQEIRVEELEKTSKQKKKLFLFQTADDTSKYYRLLHRSEKLTREEAKKKFKDFDIDFIEMTEVHRERIKKANKLMANFAKKENKK